MIDNQARMANYLAQNGTDRQTRRQQKRLKLKLSATSWAERRARKRKP